MAEEQKTGGFDLVEQTVIAFRLSNLFKMRKTILGILVFASLFPGPRDVYGQCSCIKNYPSAYEEFKDSDVVFIGRVAEINKIRMFENTKTYEVEIRFKVKRVWKTDFNNTITIRHTVDSSIDFKKGESYLVYAKYYEGLLSAWIGCCTRTRRLSRANADLKEFADKGEKPTRFIKTSKYKRLLRAAWQPLQTIYFNEADSDPDIAYGNGGIFRKRGYVEVEPCAGTGLAACTFLFEGAYGNRLRVATAGEELPKAHARVTSFRFVCD